MLGGYTHSSLFFSNLAEKICWELKNFLSVAKMASLVYERENCGGDDGGVAQDGGHPPNNRLTETCGLGLPCTFLIYDIMLWSIETCQILLSADQYNVTILRAQVYGSSRSSVLFKVTADQVLVFDWIAVSCQAKLLKTELGCSKAY